MTQEDKKLLLKDLCARLPYGIKVFHRGSVEEIQEITPTGEFKNYNYNAWFNIDTCKPYLRPMSSMTEEERLVYEQRLHDVGRSIDVIDADDVVSHTDWLLSHHFDYRGLIEKGLALEAKEGMYKND